MERHRFDPWVGKIPWRRKWQPAPVFLPGESHGRRSLVGCRLWGHKELDMTEKLGHTHICINIYVCVCVCLYFFHILFPYGLSWDIEYSSLCYAVEPCFLSILYIMVCIC